MIINPGASEKSAYQYAVDGGYTGTEAEFQALMGSGPWLPVVQGAEEGEWVIQSSVEIDGIKPTLSIRPRHAGYLGSNGFYTYAVELVWEKLNVAGPIVLINQHIKGVKTPEEDTDAANKAYVDKKANDAGAFAKRIVVSPSKINEPNTLGTKEKVYAGVYLEDKVISIVPDPKSEAVVKSCGIRCSNYSGWYLIFDCDTLPSVDVTFHIMAKSPS